MNPGKALAGRWEEGGWLCAGDGPPSLRVPDYGTGLDAGILAKGAMRHFWKIANRAIIACPGKIFL